MLKTLKTSPEIYTSVCFESQTVASNYQEFPNKNARRFGYGHKNGEYQSVGLVQARGCVACCAYSVKCPKIHFLPAFNR